jgi:hypothetical protein
MRDAYALYDVMSGCNIKNAIIDRFYPSEFVYKHNIYEDFKRLDELWKGKARILYLEAPEQVIQWRWIELEKNPGISYEKILENYELFFKQTSIPVIRNFASDGKSYEKITL